MCLACKHVDDVIIGAPYILTKDLVKSINISKVIHIVDSNEDQVLQKYQDIDPYSVAKELGIYEEALVNNDFYDITTESVALRVLANKKLFQTKLRAK